MTSPLRYFSVISVYFPATEGRDLKFPEPGIYESASEYEEVHTWEDGSHGSIYSQDYGFDKYWDRDMYHFLLVGKFLLKCIINPQNQG